MGTQFTIHIATRGLNCGLNKKYNLVVDCGKILLKNNRHYLYLGPYLNNSVEPSTMIIVAIVVHANANF